MNHLKDIAIIGAGKVGVAIGILAARAGVRVAAVAGREASRSAQAAKSIGPDVPTVTPARAAGMAGLVLLTVPDDAIEGLCSQLADAKAFRDGAVVAHCSGALAAEVLQSAAKACRCHLGSMHPMQTFPTVDKAVAALPGAFCFIEGDTPAAAALEELALAIGARPIQIPPHAKVLVHAAAVMACNYLTALLDASLDLGRQAGIDRSDFLKALEPLVRSTVDNVFALGPGAALTGPIARGDVRTIERHMKALADNTPALAVLYQALALQTIHLAMTQGAIDPAAAGKLLKIVTASLAHAKQGQGSKEQ